ncbi:hypothetical protein DFQ06_3363 [Algibacter lectus]|uniref:Uncharacterized protein n=1 Tax=Algibacter lectus TaxID=221126 RepID=A0A4R8M615_9FLAO|nr:hypothetical protein DFQ06_3363 [Algibacter lectus]
MSELYLEFVKSIKEILIAIYRDVLKKKEDY